MSKKNSSSFNRETALEGLITGLAVVTDETACPACAGTGKTRFTRLRIWWEQEQRRLAGEVVFAVEEPPLDTCRSCKGTGLVTEAKAIEIRARRAACAKMTPGERHASLVRLSAKLAAPEPDECAPH